MDISLFKVTNSKNYNDKLNEKNFQCYFKNICTLMSEFLIYTIDNVNVQNNKYYLFVIRRGLETIIHCYKFLLLYTRNYELALYHCKKAYIYYVEFIGQIGYNNNSFLQLNSKDATLFVYKKTIFDINNGERKKYVLSSKEKRTMEIVSDVLTLYKNITLLLIEREIKMGSNIAPIIQFCTKNCTKIIDTIYNYRANPEQISLYVKNIIFFIDELPIKNVENIAYIANIIHTFAKKSRKCPITKSQIMNKILSPDFQSYLNLNSHLKFVNWFLN